MLLIYYDLVQADYSHVMAFLNWGNLEDYVELLDVEGKVFAVGKDDYVKSELLSFIDKIDFFHSNDLQINVANSR